VVREGVVAGGRNDPSIVCRYELKKKEAGGVAQSVDPDFKHQYHKKKEYVITE
jgi:hypothetical protein